MLFHASNYSGIAAVPQIRGLVVCVVTALRSVWLDRQWYRFQSTNGASGASPSLVMIYSLYGFFATASVCNTAIGLCLLSAGDSRSSFWMPYWMLSLAACQGVPIFVVTIVGRARLYKFFAQENRLNRHNGTGDVTVPRHGAARKRWGVGKVFLGSIIASVFISYYYVLEMTCASNADTNEGAGELVISLGGGIFQGFYAPLFVDAGAPLSVNGTAEGELEFVENLCDEVLDCSSCPFVLDAQFNTSRLRGKIMLYDHDTNEELFMCGLNWLGRTFGRTGLIGLGMATKDSGQFDVPGHSKKLHRLGEHRDAKPRDGDAGISFPHFHASQYMLTKFLLQSGIDEGATFSAVLTPTEPNPWHSTLCGYWKPLATLFMLGHVGVTERSLSNLIGHVRTSGVRFDLAQLALVNQMIAHCAMTMVQHDPFLSFHWAAVPYGASAAFTLGSIVLACSSILMLAAYWYVSSARVNGAGAFCTLVCRTIMTVFHS